MTTVRTARIPEGDATLEGDLALPEDLRGVVLFAHGSGSSRHSPRNRFVAEHLNRSGLATLLLDLLTTAEERVDARSGQHRFDIELLARRLEAAMAWLGEDADTRALPFGLFGASTGAAAALVAAARHPEAVRAVVSRGGRPDLAGDDLGRVTAPTSLIVGGLDVTVLELNESAQGALRCETRLDVVAGATHLFEEPGALEHVADLARDWFLAKL